MFEAWTRLFPPDHATLLTAKQTLAVTRRELGDLAGAHALEEEVLRRLFELFYTKLWKEKLGKSATLWQAKMALRAEGYPLRDRGGWILSGDPE